MLLALIFAAAPALEGVPSVSNRFSLGHMCPVSPTMAWTAAHVIDPAPFIGEVPLTHLYWSDRLGNGGKAQPIRGVPSNEDLGLVMGTFPVTFPIAKVAPREGELVYMSGYGYRMAATTVKAKFKRMAGNIMIFDRNPEGGSSGGCVLNEGGEVVGIVVWGFPGEDAGGAVLVAGREIPSPEIPE